MADYKFGVHEPPHKRWPVAWYNPMVLARSALEVFSTDHFIRNFDRRELFGGDFAVVDQTLNSHGGDYGWDFVSDTGDGGNASYTVARAILSPSLTAGAGSRVNPDTAGSFPAGRMLVLGGDLAYPGAGTEEYQYRFIEMWEAAKPTEQKPEITVASIPQNHDWFDNISSFSRHFVGNYDNHFLRASTPQNRSYFAARLPHGWWILGLDFALVGDIDREQYETFLRLIAHPSGNHPVRIQPGDNVILLYPEPYWTRPLGDSADAGYPKRYQRLEAAHRSPDMRAKDRRHGRFLILRRPLADRSKFRLQFRGEEGNPLRQRAESVAHRHPSAFVPDQLRKGSSFVVSGFLLVLPLLFCNRRLHPRLRTPVWVPLLSRQILLHDAQHSRPLLVEEIPVFNGFPVRPPHRPAIVHRTKVLLLLPRERAQILKRFRRSHHVALMVRPLGSTRRAGGAARASDPHERCCANDACRCHKAAAGICGRRAMHGLHEKLG